MRSQNSTDDKILQMNSVRLALLGCGRWGKNLLRVFSELPDCKVQTICTRSESEDVRALVALHQTEWCHDREAILRDGSIDAIVITTPDTTHFPLAKASIEAGKHLFVEK